MNVHSFTRKKMSLFLSKKSDAKKPVTKKTRFNIPSFAWQLVLLAALLCFSNSISFRLFHAWRDLVYCKK
jgi:hypothetical protein